MNEIKVFQRAIFLCLLFSYTPLSICLWTLSESGCCVTWTCHYVLASSERIRFCFILILLILEIPTFRGDSSNKHQYFLISFLPLLKLEGSINFKEKYCFFQDQIKTTSFLVLWPSGNIKTTEQSTFSLALEHLIFSLTEDIASSLGTIFLARIFWQL